MESCSFQIHERYFFSHCASFYSILFTKELRSGNLTDKWESCSCGSWWVLWFSYVRVVEGKCFSPSNEIIYDPLLNETTETPKRQNITKRPLGWNEPDVPIGIDRYDQFHTLLTSMLQNWSFIKQIAVAANAVTTCLFSKHTISCRNILASPTLSNSKAPCQ